MDKSRYNGNDANGQYPWDKPTWSKSTHFVGSSSMMDKIKYGDNFGQYPWKESNWSNQTHSAGRSCPIDVSKYNGNNVRSPWDYSDRLNQSQNKYTSSLQAIDKPKNNDPKPWKNKNFWKKPNKSNSKRTPPCGFCKNNRESPECFNNHSVNDKYDRVSCPRLFNYVCPLCRATGYNAHTLIYCPLNSGQ